MSLAPNPRMTLRPALSGAGGDGFMVQIKLKRRGSVEYIISTGTRGILLHDIVL